jgi:hypothetical protein
MDKNIRIFGEVSRWGLVLLGALAFSYGIGIGRWDSAVIGLLLIQFSMAISLKLKIMEIRNKIGK